MSFSQQPPFSSSTATTTLEPPIATSLSTIHPDILQSHVLTRLDGLSLFSAACTSTELNSLASHRDLWTNICHSTWPSTNTPRIREIISRLPNGSRSFFSESFPLTTGLRANLQRNYDFPSELISAVDIHYKNKPIFSKVVETETSSAWFLCSPFRIDMLDPKDTCRTPIPNSGTEETCHDLAGDLSLSWILIDPTRLRSMNLSSHKPVSVQRHWLSGEVHARFATVLAAGERGSASECVQCGIVVTCGGGAQGGEMDVRGVSLQVEDMDGVFLDGEGSLGIFSAGFEGKKGNEREEGNRGAEKVRDVSGKEEGEEGEEVEKGRDPGHAVRVFRGHGFFLSRVISLAEINFSPNFSRAVKGEGVDQKSNSK
ncbi:hypothetical protein OIU77_031005 [Salix suchowensis]|uniref:F-box domain-containing protein n=1 Tax=Salix suchowensis TaxID=1278906 RepID=A0ABQ9BGJ9_9ROSI|nr:hypothetical protein OIU77_031005 [Salix suchowensis]